MTITPEVKSLLRFSIQSSINAYSRPKELGAIDFSIYDKSWILTREISGDFNPFKKGKETTTKVECIISETGNRQAITFQGSTGFIDWIDNFKFFRENDQYRMPADVVNNNSADARKIKIHSGFREQANLVIYDILEAIREYRSGCKKNGIEPETIITGHSLGGALANAVSYAICDMEPSYAGSLIVIPHASPRVGNKAFAHALPSSVKFYLRTVFETDIVTRVPLGIMGYHHAEPSLVLSKGKRHWYDRILSPIEENIGSTKDHYPQGYRDAINRL